MTNTDIILKLNQMKYLSQVAKLLPYCEELHKKPSGPVLKKLTRELEPFTRQVQQDNHRSWYRRSKDQTSEEIAEGLIREFKKRIVKKMQG